MLPKKSSKVNSKELAFLLVLNKFFRPHPRCECSYMREKKKSEPLNLTALILVRVFLRHLFKKVSNIKGLRAVKK